MPTHTEIKLPISGRTAVIRRPTGRDMVEAERIAGPNAGPIAIQFATLSRITMIDGHTLPYEDFLACDIKDLETIRDTEVGSEPLPFGQENTPPT